MIYLSGEGLKLIILETANIEEIKKGHPAKTPDGSVLIAWTPDPVWLADKILETDGDTLAIGRLIEEAAKRPQREPRPHHKLHTKRLHNEG